MGIKELKETLEKRRIFLERKLESKKLPHCNGVNPNIIIETEAKLEEVEKILDLLSNESFKKITQEREAKDGKR